MIIREHTPHTISSAIRTPERLHPSTLSHLQKPLPTAWQQHLHTSLFQSVEKESAPRSKFVQMALQVSVARVSVLYSFGRSKEMPGKRDSFGRSKGLIYGEVAFQVSVARVSVLYSFGRSKEMHENATPSEGVQDRFTAKVGLGRFRKAFCGQRQHCGLPYGKYF